MQSRKKLFKHKNLYNVAGTDALFTNAVRETVTYHAQNCMPYQKILENFNFKADCLQNIEDLHRIPALPTLYLKQHNLFSVPNNKLLLNGTSSGTSGKPSHVGMDFDSSRLALNMVLRTFNYYKLFSMLPTNYIVLGYQPSKHNKMGAVQTAYATTLAAPALHREYALKDMGTDYKLNVDGILNALHRYEKQNLPVRFMGFPHYFLLLLEELEKQNIKFVLHPKSKVFLAGGWKQFLDKKIDKFELYERSKEFLGIEEYNCKEFFGAVEHPVLYCDCKNHHFHIPVYSRVIIRDPVTLKPLPYGQPGIMNLISPLMKSMPFVSIMTDDIAVLHPPKTCGCQIESPWFEILGRAGANIKTCSATAQDLLKEVII